MSVVINGVTLKNATCNGEKVKKIYYNDGTTSHLIYSAEEYLLKNGHTADFTLTTLRKDASSYGETQNTDSLSLTATNNALYWKLGINRKYTAQKVNVSGYDKIVADFNCHHAWGNGGIQFGLATAVDGSDVVKYELANTTGKKAAELDISGYNGDYYIFFGSFVWSENNTSGSVESLWYKVKLE